MNKIYSSVPGFVIDQTLISLSKIVRSSYKDPGCSRTLKDPEFDECVTYEPTVAAIDCLSQAKVQVKTRINIETESNLNHHKLKSKRSSKGSFSQNRKHSLIMSKSKSVKFEMNDKRQSVTIEDQMSLKGVKTPKNSYK